MELRDTLNNLNQAEEMFTIFMVCLIIGFLLILFLKVIFIIIDIYRRRRVSCVSCNKDFKLKDCGTCDEKYYCMKCYKKHFNVCDICKKIVDEKLIKFHRKNLCNICNKDKIIKCHRCKQKYGKWEMEKDLTGLKITYHCKECYEIIKPRYFKTINFNPAKVMPKTFRINPFNRYCGVEIECRNRQRDKNCFIKSELKGLNFSQCYDGSLNSGGVEFVSRPMNGDNLFNTISNFCKKLNKKKYFVDRSCGLHIHMEIPKEVNYLKKIYLFYEKFESILFKMVPKSRQNTSFCKKFKKYYKINTEDIFKIKTLNDFKSMVYETKSRTSIRSRTLKHSNAKKYCWINFHSIFYRGTLEIRNHSGTTMDEKINNWLLLHLTILNYLNQVDIETINDLKVNKKTFLSIFTPKLRTYIKYRWAKFENTHKEEKY